MQQVKTLFIFTFMPVSLYGACVVLYKGPAPIAADGLIASNRTLHREFMQKTEGLAWRRPTHLTA